MLDPEAKADQVADGERFFDEKPALLDQAIAGKPVLVGPFGPCCINLALRIDGGDDRRPDGKTTIGPGLPMAQVVVDRGENPVMALDEGAGSGG